MRLSRYLSALVLACALSATAGTPIVWGPGKRVILNPDSTVSNAGFTFTGAATAHEAVDDGEWVSDDGTTYIQHPNDGVTVSRVELGLPDSALYAATNTSILYVGAWLEYARGSGSGKSAVTCDLGWRIGGADYSHVVFNADSTSYLDRATNNSTERDTLNPATGLAWTSADVDGLVVYVTCPITTAYQIRITRVYVAVVYEFAEPVTTTRERSGGGN